MTAELTPYRCDERHAREITEQIRTQGEKFFQLLMRSYEWEAWRALGYESWRAYAMAEFGIGKSRAYELLDQARVIKAIEGVGGVSGIPEINAGQAEALKPILKDHGPEAAAEVLAAASENGKPTAAAIRQVAEDTGKAKVTTTTRTSEATKVEQVVDTETGEIVEDAARRDPESIEKSRQQLNDFIEADPGHNDRRYVINFLKALTPVTDVPKYDAEKLAQLLDANEFFITEKSIVALMAWLEQVRASRRPRLIGVK